MTGQLRCSIADRIMTIVIDNEAKRNAMSRRMTDDLGSLLEQADTDDSVAVVVVTGAGRRAFCSGHDIAELIDNPEAAYDAAINEAFRAPRQIRKPTIGAINGAAFAGGLNLALACDVRIGSTTASFAATGARLAMLPIAGQLSVLPTLVGAGPALDLLLRARVMDAARAHEVGLLSQVVEPDELMEVVAEAAAFMASTPIDLNAAIKRAVWTTVDAAGTQARTIEVGESEAFGRSPEAAKRLQAFLSRK